MSYDSGVNAIGRLKIGELAERTGTSVAQLRKWQDRYAIVEPERQQDPDRNGVAVVVDVDSVTGAGKDGFFQQARD